jgi:CcmD family protein
MVTHLWWLVGAYSLIWIVLFGYVGALLARQRRLEREVDRLRAERAAR